jgi:hypothetical protein
MLPSLTNNRINFKESMVGLIPSAIIGFLAFILTVISAIFVFKNRKAAVPNQPQ